MTRALPAGVLSRVHWPWNQFSFCRLRTSRPCSLFISVILCRVCVLERM